MLSSENILKLPGISPNYAVSSNGGSKEFNTFIKGAKSWITIKFNGDNFIMKKDNDPRLNQVLISKHTYDKDKGNKFEDRHSEEVLFKGEMFDISELENFLISK